VNPIMLGLGFTVLLFTNSIHASERSWVKVAAPTIKQRAAIANVGISIESVLSDYVTGIATEKEKAELQAKGWLLDSMPLEQATIQDFPAADSIYHNYTELTNELKTLASNNADIVALDSIGKSLEGREIWHLRISTDLANSSAKPGAVFMGGHHAREHLSIETPFLLAQKLIQGYRTSDLEVIRLIQGREIHIIPMVNPDGAEHDIASGSYRYWRKNRRPVTAREFGVDLNRNYDLAWGSVGASNDPASDTYRGAKAFSEPETQAIKKFIEDHTNLTVLLSFHTFSELILYPWGHTYDKIGEDRDFQVHKTMAETMAQWNGYTPEQSSDLYPAAGDTTDWAYGVHHIVSFTFELDPTDMFRGGFYPGASVVENVSRKNWLPCLYLIDHADNPYRVLQPVHMQYGLNSALVQ
jgi:carboxypeptidase T